LLLQVLLLLELLLLLMLLLAVGDYVGLVEEEYRVGEVGS
jgi:hypothetical protein